MPTTTYEVRWFVRNEPMDVAAVFGSECRPELRTDWYAASTNEGTGTKLREGRLETKLRTDVVATIDHAGCRGVMERWQKWSAPLSEAIPGKELLRINGWTAVEKERWLQVWSADHAVLERASDRVGNGALFEVTRLSVSGQSWWTVGFEAFGAEGERQPALERVMHHVLEHLPEHQRLMQRDSMGYPAWLLHLQAGI